MSGSILARVTGPPIHDTCNRYGFLEAGAGDEIQSWWKLRREEKTMYTNKAVFVGLAMAAAWLAADTSAALAAGALSVVERAASDTVTDLGVKGDSVGDVLTFSNEIYDETNKTVVGRDNGWCVRTVAGQSWECFWTIVLEKGQITVEGPFYDSKDSVLAVTGGTGAYAAARGEMKLHARDDKGTEYDFVYSLTDAQ